MTETSQKLQPRRSLAKLARVGQGRGTVALLDQVLISGSNFAANIVLVRGLGLAGFGRYYLAYVIVLYANAIQMSLVTAPMLVIAPLMEGEAKRTFLQGMLALQVIASLVLLAVGMAIGSAINLYTHYYSLPCVVAISFAIGAFQLQDWVRRYYFIVRKEKLAVVSDTISYVLQLVALATLWRLHQLTLTRTFLVMALTSAAAFSMGPITDRLRPSLEHWREAWAQCKELSRDLLVSNQVRWFGSQGILLIATAIVGPTGIGGLRATQSLAGPVNLVLSSLDNVLPMRIAELLKSGGTSKAYLFTRNTILLATLGLGTLLVPLAIFGKPLLRVVYGPAVVAFYLPMLLQVMSMLIEIASRLWFYLYRGVRDTRAILRANVLCTVTSVGTVYVLGRIWGASGIVLSSLLGQLVIVFYCVFHWRLYRAELLLRYPSPATAPESPLFAE